MMLALMAERAAGWAKRWWAAPLCGLILPLCFPPLNHETHPALALFPFISFAALVPLLHFACIPRRRSALLRMYLFGIIAALGQFYWIANVVYENLWPMIMLGLCLASLYVGLYYLFAGALFRIIIRAMPQWAIAIFPAAWVLIEYSRTIGELAFPWLHLGYAMTPVLSVAQAASVGGVFGLSLLIAAGNVAIYQWLIAVKRRAPQRTALMRLAGLCAVLAAVGVWGFARMRIGAAHQNDGPLLRISLLQSYMDQSHWGNQSLDTALVITESMVYEAWRAGRPDLMVLPESALLCYLARSAAYRQRVQGWVDSVRTPLILGALHWEKPPKDSYYEYWPYNTAFLVTPQSKELTPYHKMRLLPFSEAMPFEAKFPILSRVNLGESDFRSGTDPVIFDAAPGLRAGPFICYEMIFPALVRQRVRLGANLLVNITNDGWFGRSTAAFHHAAMARMRCIENGVSMARCANSGISVFTDQFGRMLGSTRLYTRTILTRDVSLKRFPTLYTRLGDWPVGLSLMLTLAAVGRMAASRWRAVLQIVRLAARRRHSLKNKQLCVDASFLSKVSIN